MIFTKCIYVACVPSTLGSCVHVNIHYVYATTTIISAEG